jgi:hypothetical protein
MGPLTPLLSRWNNSPATGRPRPTGTRATSNRRRPYLEALEDRALLSTYTVNVAVHDH